MEQMSNRDTLNEFLLPDKKSPNRTREIERKKLYYDYLYIKNYEKETEENKKELREYFDERLHYPNAFYRFRSKFKKRGNPLNWSDTEVKRYYALKNIRYYERGVKKFERKGLFFPQTEGKRENFILRLEYLKTIDLINFDNNGVPHINSYAVDKLETISRSMIKTLQKIDNLKGKARGEFQNKGRLKGIEERNLRNVRIVINIDCIDFERVLSTPYLNPKDAPADIGLVLRNYLEAITKQNVKKLLYKENYPEETEDDFFVKQAKITSIEVHKWSNKPFSIIGNQEKRKRVGKYTLYIRRIRSFISRVK